MGAAFDLDAARTAALNEPSAQEVFTFTRGTDKFVIPNPAVWPLPVAALLAKGEVVEFVREVLTLGNKAKGARRVKEPQETRFFDGADPATPIEVRVLFRAISEWLGNLTPGE